MKFATINAPERTDPTKRNLLAPARRAIGILRWMRREGIDVAVLQESGSVMRACVAAHPKWQWSAAPPNTVIRGHQIGNALVTRKATIAILDKAAINVPLAGRKHGLWLPERLLLHTPTGATFDAVGVHKARAKGVPGGAASRAASDRLVSERANAAAGAGFPVVIGGDWNGQPPQIEDFKVAASHKADAILVSGDVLVVARGHSALPGLSDHDAAWAELVVPVTDVRPKRLPKP